MKSRSLLAALTLVNFGMLAFLLTHQVVKVQADSPEQVLRARALEIVDAQGRLRASLQVIPEGPSRRADGSMAEQNGKVYP